MDIKKIQILGPFSTGTNLLAKILRENLKEKVNIHHEGHTIFWKHTMHRHVIINAIKKHKDALFICLYKPLNNWIYSMKKYSYDIRWSKKLKDKCSFQRVEYDNIVTLHNRFYNMYIEFINNVDRVIFMNYYDIINKKIVINYISNKLSKFKLNIKQNNNILTLLNKPSKDHGDGVGSSNEAIEKKKQCINEMNKLENKIIINKYFRKDIKDYFEK